MKVTVMLSPSRVVRLDAYADGHRWSRSGAIAALIERGLDEAEKEGQS